MNPKPLLFDNGQIAAYMCGVCNKIPSVGEPICRLDVNDEHFQEKVEDYKQQSEDCCKCATCKEPLSEEDYYECATCTEKSKIEREKRDKEYEIELAKRKKIWDEHISKAKNEISAIKILNTIEGLSEDYWCAGWLQDIEYDIWGAVLEVDNKTSDYHYKYPDNIIKLLKEHSRDCGGWWIREDFIRKFITIEEWQVKYQEYLIRMEKLMERLKSE